MSFRTDFRTYVLGRTTITDLVAQRVYVGLAPKSATMPYVLFEVTSNFSHQHQASASDLAEAKINVEIYDDSLLGAEAIAEAFRGELDGLTSNGTGEKTFGTTIIRRVSLEDDQDTFTVNEGTQEEEWMILQNYTLWYYRSVGPPT